MEVTSVIKHTLLHHFGKIFICIYHSQLQKGKLSNQGKQCSFLRYVGNLIWKWQCDEVKMMQQNGFVVKIPKSVTSNNTVNFLYLSHVMEVCCTPTTCNCWSFFFIRKFQIYYYNKNVHYLPEPPFLKALWGLVKKDGTKNAASVTGMATQQNTDNCTIT